MVIPKVQLTTINPHLVRVWSVARYVMKTVMNHLGITVWRWTMFLRNGFVDKSTHDFLFSKGRVVSCG